MMVPLSLSCKAPATISLAEAEFSLISYEIASQIDKRLLGVEEVAKELRRTLLVNKEINKDEIHNRD